MNPLKQFRLIWMMAFVACYSAILAGNSQSPTSGYFSCLISVPVLIACFVSFEYGATDEWAIAICVGATVVSSIVFLLVVQAFHFSSFGSPEFLDNATPLVLFGTFLGLLAAPYTLFIFFVIAVFRKS